MPTEITQDCSLTDAAYLKLKHSAGLGYADYLATGTPDQQAGWSKIYDQVTLNESQRDTLGGFVREIKVLAVSGIWCGDCVRQGPMLHRIAEGSNGKIDLKWLDRDEHIELQEKVKICAGNRVPVVIFAAEDFELVGYEGDKLLSRYRAMAKSALGPNCPLPGAPVPQDELDAELADWVDAFERVHLILRLSGRLRKKHGD
ncbi:thioredoxin family protein [Phycisphaeraceae bacterium D3-23]